MIYVILFIVYNKKITNPLILKSSTACKIYLNIKGKGGAKEEFLGWGLND